MQTPSLTCKTFTASLTLTATQRTSRKLIGHYSEQGEVELPPLLPAGAAAVSGSTPRVANATYPVRLVCFCDGDNVGNYYEVKPTSYGSFDARAVLGNTVLMKRYGITRTK
jgi:hypothetical protein